MERVKLNGRHAADLVQPGLGEVLLAQARPRPPARITPDKPAPAVRKTFAFKLGGFPGEAVPLRRPSRRGQRLYKVSWHVNGRVVSVQAALTGPIGLDQFKPGSPLKHQLEQALRASQARETSPAAPAVPLGYQRTPTIKAWSPLVPLPKPLAQMNPAERILYTVEVAGRYLPADLTAQLQALVTPQTALALGAYAAAHAVGMGFIADGVALVLAIPGMAEAVSKFDQYLRTTLQAKHPMELAKAGRQLSEVAAPLVMHGATLLGVLGVARAGPGVLGRRGAGTGRGAAQPVRTAVGPRAGSGLGGPVINVRAVTVWSKPVPPDATPAARIRPLPPANLPRQPGTPETPRAGDSGAASQPQRARPPASAPANALVAAGMVVSSTQPPSPPAGPDSTLYRPPVVQTQKNHWPNQAPAGNQSGSEAQARMLAQLDDIRSPCDDQVKAVQALAPHVEKEPLGTDTPVKAKLLEVLANRRRDPEVREAAAWALGPHWMEESSRKNTPVQVEKLEYLQGEIDSRRSQWRLDGRL